MHGHITNIGLAIYVDVVMPEKVWGEAFMVVVNIINVLPISVLNVNSPYTIKCQLNSWP